MKKLTPHKVRAPHKQSRQPGHEWKMNPKPDSEDTQYQGSGKLKNKVALITGGDSGIGRAVAYCYAKEGAEIVISYLSETQDAEETAAKIRSWGGKCLVLRGDIGKEKVCKEIVRKTISEFGSLNILVNNAAEQHPKDDIKDITAAQLEKTFRTNVFSIFYLTQASLKHMKRGATIINTTSVTAYRGSPALVDYSATKGAIVSFTRSLSTQLAPKGIRVNGVAPGPVWTPLIPATFDKKKVAEFGSDVPLRRAGQPEEIAPAYVYLASAESEYMTGQVLHLNGGEIING